MFCPNIRALSSLLSFSVVVVFSNGLPFASISISKFVSKKLSDDLSVNKAESPFNNTPIDISKLFILTATAGNVVEENGLVYIPSGKPLSISIPSFCSYCNLSKATPDEFAGSKLDKLVLNNVLIFEI